jgi:threonine synthase
VPKEFFPPIPVGNTPLWEPRLLREELGLEGLFLKDDTANPTGSLKDRASYLVAAFALQHGLEDIIVASTGNAGSSMAGVAAAAGLNVRLYLPASAPPAKIVQAMQYGANVIKVEGSYDDAFDQSLAYVTEHGGLSRNTAHNPLTVEGKKTVSLEIFRQLRASMPDVVYVPTGDGVIISGVFKGFEDLLTLGIADKMPEVVCVQAEGSAALTRALEAGKFKTPQPAHTIADSISVDVPRGGLYALGRLQKHSGRCVTVSDEAIVSAQRRLSSSSGLFAEPAASAAFAGLLADLEAGRGPGKKDRAVVLLTGNGLKDIATAMKGVEG